jgi:hypothetical protein
MTSMEGAQPLQDLCEVQLLEHMLGSDTADGEFSLLDARTQQLLFSRLRKEVKRLREIEKNWSRLTERCPYVDREMYLLEEAEEAKISYAGYDSDGSEDSYSYFDRWESIPDAEGGITSAFPDPDDIDDDNGDPTLPLLTPQLIGETHDPIFRAILGSDLITWNSYQLFANSPASRLKICSHSQGDNCMTCHPDKGTCFWQRISSQLLFYRLTVMFCMPPAREPFSRISWEMQLQYRDGISILRLEDYRGAAHVSFQGTREGSARALKLLNYVSLVSHEHTSTDRIYINSGTRASDLYQFMSSRI